jgi:RND family efflux transporter MFP subunit
MGQAWRVVVLGIALASCTPEKRQADGPDRAPAVEIVRARSGALPLEERLTGTVRARNQVTVRPEIEAAVAEVFVRSGDAVRKGDPLVRLRDDGLREQLQQAQAAVALQQAAAKVSAARVAELQAQATRARTLAAEQLVSRLELETLEAQLLAAQAGADEAAARLQQAHATEDERRAALDKTVVRAPISGRVGRRQAEVGMLATTDTALFEMGSLDRLIVEAPVTAEMLPRLRPGHAVRITAPGLDGAVEARLSRIPPFLAPASLSTIAEIDVTNPDGALTPGSFVTVDVVYGESRTATVIPTSALVEDPRTGTSAVFVAAYDGREPAGGSGTGPLSERAFPVAQRAVQVLAEGRGQVGVSGVEEGEWVVSVGQHLLADDASPTARVRPNSDARVLEMQTRQREDVLEGFLAEQQRLARERGAVPPTNREFMRAASPAPAADGRTGR